MHIIMTKIMNLLILSMITQLKTKYQLYPIDLFQNTKDYFALEMKYI